ncbi:MAG: CCA tRNA nucleotidyltransferase [Parachlamydiales bacterium]|nr:CCA tRNA nucleotidyltransferase [Parachlamydiales bacterium]
MLEAKLICKTLQSKGYTAYFAGGWVRDFLLNHPSEDIDIATDAPPEIVESLFDHTVPIGKKFGIILVVLNSKQYEVATFRKDIEYKDGRRPSKIEFSSAKIDAHRRDFTINGMFFDPLTEEIIDFVNGKEDLKNKLIKAIGNAHERFKEDRLRMIRAIRLSCRFGFEIEINTKRAIISHAEELFPSVAIERIWQELTKMSQYSGFKTALITLHEYNLLQTIFPILKNSTIEEVKERLLIIDDFPHRTPVIISILELFLNFSLEDKIELCQYLKLSNRETQFVSFMHSSKIMLENSKHVDDFNWAYFFANHFSELAIDIIAVHISKDNRAQFLEFLNNKKEKLLDFIKRIKDSNPVLKSENLKLCNIEPGILMGSLLKEGEKISINKNLTDPYQVIEELKKTKLWPK